MNNEPRPLRPYERLDVPGLEERLEQVTHTYWDTMEYLSNLVAERATLMNLISDRRQERGGIAA